MTTDQLNWQKDNFENIENAWEGDLWDRRRLGEQLTNYVDRLNCGAVLALDARWGEGKTWFVRHWKRHLETTQPHKHDVIYLDAFANDYLDDPFLVIASEIAAKLDQTAQNKPLVHKFKKAAAVMQQELLTLAPTIIASMISCALTGGIIPLIKIDSDKIIDKLDDTIDKVTENISEKVTEAIQNKIDSYEEEKQSLIAFKHTLSELAASLEKPLVFIIDELDRCRPDFAIRLIERIKHFFDIPKIVFVLVMNKQQFVCGIQHIYGYEQDEGRIYLEKFIDFEIPLRNRSMLGKSLKDFSLIKSLMRDIGEVSIDIVLIFLLSLEENISMRHLKRKVNLYALLRKNDIKKNMFIALALNKKYIDCLNDMEGIALKIKKMQEGNQNISRIDMAHFNVHELLIIIEQKLSVNLGEIYDYFKKLNSIEQLRLNYNNERYLREFNSFLNIYALQPLSEMQGDIFIEQYRNYINNNVWLDSVD